MLVHTRTCISTYAILFAIWCTLAALTLSTYLFQPHVTTLRLHTFDTVKKHICTVHAYVSRAFQETRAFVLSSFWYSRYIHVLVDDLYFIFFLSFLFVCRLINGTKLIINNAHVFAAFASLWMAIVRHISRTFKITFFFLPIRSSRMHRSRAHSDLPTNMSCK